MQSSPIAIIVSLFNREITESLQEGAVNRLLQQGISSADITVVLVPGAIEISIVAQKLAKKGCFSAIIALGAVVRGETSHYDYVCQLVSSGCQKVALKYEIPVIFGVLTTENEAQAWDRLGGKHGHKGIESADAALAMRSIVQLLDNGTTNNNLGTLK